MPDTFQCMVMVNIMTVYANMTAESCSLAGRSDTKAIVGFSSIVLLEYNTVDPSKGCSVPIFKDIIETHVKLLRYTPCDVHLKGQISRTFDQTTFTILYKFFLSFH